MRQLTRRLLRLVVDSPLLAGATLAWIAACAAAVQLGASRSWLALAFPAGLVLVLALSIGSATRERRS